MRTIEADNVQQSFITALAKAERSIHIKDCVMVAEEGSPLYGILAGAQTVLN